MDRKEIEKEYMSIVNGVQMGDMLGIDNALGDQTLLQKISDTVTQLESLATERLSLLDQLKSQIREDDITSFLLLNSKLMG